MSNNLQDIRQFLLDAVNEQRGLELTQDDVVFYPPSMVDDSVVDLTTEARNSQLVITVNNSPLVARVKYNRLDISLLFTNGIPSLPDSSALVTKADLAALVSRSYGLNISADDIVDGPLIKGTNPSHYDATLEFNGHSLAFMKQCTFRLLKSGEPPSEDNLVYEGFFLHNMQRALVALDFASINPEPVEDSIFPIVNHPTPITALISGGYRNELIALTLQDRYDTGELVGRLHVSHNGAQGPWTEQDLDEPLQPLIAKGTFFKGVAFLPCMVGTDFNAPKFVYRFILEDAQSQRYRAEQVFEMDSEVEIVATEQHIALVDLDYLHISSDGVNWQREPAVLATVTTCADGSDLVGIGYVGIEPMFWRYTPDAQSPWSGDVVRLEGYVDMDPSLWFIDRAWLFKTPVGFVLVASIGVVDTEMGFTRYRECEVFTAPSMDALWTRRMTDSGIYVFTPPIYDGSSLAILGLNQSGEGLYWMAWSTDHGVSWNYRGEDSLPYADSSGVATIGTAICHRTGTAPTVPPLPDSNADLVAALPTRGTGARWVLSDADGSMIIGGESLGMINGNQNGDGPQVRCLAATFPNGQFDPFRTLRCMYSLAGIGHAPEGKFIVGGQFETAWGDFNDWVQPQLVHRLNEQFTLDRDWVPPPNEEFTTQYDNTPRASALYVYPDGRVLVGSNVISHNGDTTPGVLRLNADGTRDTSFVSPLLGDGGYPTFVRALPSGRIVIHGANTPTPLGDARPLVTDASGTILPALIDLGQGVPLYEACEFDNSSLYLFGEFPLDGVTRLGVKLNPDGSRDASWIGPSIAVRGVYRYQDRFLLSLWGAYNQPLLELLEDGTLQETSLSWTFSSYFLDAVQQPHGPHLFVGDMQTVGTRGYPFLGSHFCEGLVRIYNDGNEVDPPTETYRQYNDANAGWPWLGSEGSINLPCYSPLHFVTAANDQLAMGARVTTGEGGDLEDSHRVITPDGGSYFINQTWCWELLFFGYHAWLAEAQRVEVIFQLSTGESVRYILLAIDGEARLVHYEDESNSFGSYFWNTVSNGDASSFSIDGKTLMTQAFPNWEGEETEAGYAKVDCTMRILIDDEVILTTGSAFALPL